MNKLDALAKAPKLKTQAELLALIGQPHGPCDVCGSNLFAVTARGELLCGGCDRERYLMPRGIELRLIILILNGEPVACDAEAIETERERVAALAAIDANGFKVKSHEWIGWDAPGWCYAARVDGVPLGEIELWIRRTRGINYQPDDVDFWRGCSRDRGDGITAAWWPIEEAVSR